jgi:hypothetical protein
MELRKLVSETHELLTGASYEIGKETIESYITSQETPDEAGNVDLDPQTVAHAIRQYHITDK